MAGAARKKESAPVRREAELELKATPARRTPLQERSNETVQHIFQAASSLLADVPLEEITTSRIAAAAGVSVGGLYRFFPDKQAIIDAIAVQHVEQFRKILLRRVARSALSDGRKFLGKVLDTYVEFLDEHPDFRAIALGRHISPGTREHQSAPDAGPAALVRWFMMWRLGIHDKDELDVKLRVAIETGDRLIAFAYAQESLEERKRVISELKRMLAGYLFQ